MNQAALESLLWFGALVGIILSAIVVLLWLRKRLQNADPGATLGLTLDDLRRQRERGMLTPQEYQRLKAVVLRAAMGDRPRDAQSSPHNLVQSEPRT